MINSIALQETHLIKLNNIQSRKKNYFNKLETELFKPKMEYLQKKKKLKHSLNGKILKSFFPKIGNMLNRI